MVYFLTLQFYSIDQYVYPHDTITPSHLITVAVVVSLKSGSVGPPNFFFLKIFLAILALLNFSIILGSACQF